VRATSSHPPDRRAGRPREHLRTEAHAEHRDLGGEDVPEEPLLAREPFEAVVLIRVLGAAEHHHGVVARRGLGRAAIGHLPALECVSGRLHGLLEHSTGHARAVGDGEGAHSVTVDSAGLGQPASGYDSPMPMVTQCTALGCKTLTMGPLCIEHDRQPVRTFVRGRPVLRIAPDAQRVVTPIVPYAPSLRRASERAVAVPHRR
jgi:hypothetical protein